MGRRQSVDTTSWNPSGGPLSPLLANIAMANMVPHILARYAEESGTKTSPPRVAIYADDMIVIHRDRHIAERSQIWIDEYLTNLGLKLSPTKTKICHTEKVADTATQAGFDFLGVHFQHVERKGKTGNKGIRKPFLLATPSKKSQQAIYKECKELIKRCKVTRKQRGHRHRLRAKGKTDQVSLLIINLNRKLRGWSDYHRVTNAKKTFSSMDHKIFNLLWRWSTRNFKGKTRQWVIDNLFSGIETDRDGNPLKRRDGTLRERKWVFCSPFVTRDQKQKTLIKLADVPVTPHTLIKFGTNYYDGCWVYWQRRSSKLYPGTPKAVCLTAFRRQKGKCVACKETFTDKDAIHNSRDNRRVTLAHKECPSSGESATSTCHV